MDLNLLTVTVAANSCLAADRLSVSRVAISQAILRLEDELGSLLVQRTTCSVRLTEAGERFLDGPLLARFVEAYPEVTLDITVTDEEFDIVTRGFDAGVRLGEVIEQDMIGIPVTGTQREVAVATPTYFARHGRPMHPRELADHRCIGWRPAPDVAPWRWELSERGCAFDVAVSPCITVGMEDSFRLYLERGELERVLETIYCLSPASIILLSEPPSPGA